MDAIALHTELRNALSLSDELGRHEHAAGQQTLAGQLAALRTTLGELEREAGQTHRHAHVASPVLVGQLERSLAVLRDHAEEIPLQLRPRIVVLMDAVERIIFAERRPASRIPSKPLFGMLPIARVIPQDVHSVGDYLVSATFFASALIARTRRGRAMGLMLGAAYGGVSLVTDYRLSLAKIVPIEVHELADHATGLQAATAPLVLGYAKKDPIASAIQILTGLGTIALSLFTDYRAEKGVGRARRSKGGPRPVRFEKEKAPASVKPVSEPEPEPSTAEAYLVRPRVSEVQRPLEGFAGPSYIPGPESELPASSEALSSEDIITERY